MNTSSIKQELDNIESTIISKLRKHKSGIYKGKLLDINDCVSIETKHMVWVGASPVLYFTDEIIALKTNEPDLASDLDTAMDIFKESIRDIRYTAGASPNFVSDNIKSLYQKYPYRIVCKSIILYVRFYFNFFNPIDCDNNSCELFGKLRCIFQESDFDYLLDQLSVNEKQFIEKALVKYHTSKQNPIDSVIVNYTLVKNDSFRGTNIYEYSLIDAISGKRLGGGCSSTELFMHNDAHSSIKNDHRFSSSCKILFEKIE